MREKSAHFQLGFGCLLSAVLTAACAQKDATLGEQTLVGSWLFIPFVFIWSEKIGPIKKKNQTKQNNFAPFTALALPRNQWVWPEKDYNWILNGPKKQKETRTTLLGEQLSWCDTVRLSS